ncbi:MAG: MerR family transcriptional regulator [Robiginitomaculum sp.]
MPTKSSRAFRSISEASLELDLKPHVLRFWEAKFPDLKPITRGGGRRFYRPEDVDFLRGLRILLHDEKHKIKDVQKLIKVKGAQSLVELGHSANEIRTSRPIEQRNQVPARIKAVAPPRPAPKPVAVKTAPIAPAVQPVVVPFTPAPKPDAIAPQKRADLESSLDRLSSLRSRWSQFKDEDKT